ncbi:MAG: magnesium/cobalt transporter CorA [Vicingaceae bacterium]|nr:magnesium/cobalt transporter CorA [Vicingaceae bacterium]
MNDSTSQFHKKTGMPPGTLIHVGNRKEDKTRISVIDYNSTNFEEYTCKKIEESFTLKDSKTVSWINIDGLHNVDMIDRLGKNFDLHPLLLEDILNTRHRPKTEEFDNYTFVTLKMLGVSKDRKSIITEQVSFILGENWLISFQEKQGDVFDIVRERLRGSMGNIRKLGADYLLYRLMDIVVDNYFFVTEHFSDVTEELEGQVLTDPEPDILQRIQRLKKQLIAIRKAVNPLREAVSLLEKDTKLFKEGTKRYLRDVYEHIIQVNDTIESQRDSLSSIMDLYHTSVSNRMNEIMKVLTIISTIFIPLTFIAGIYGMNFEIIPELKWKYGYLGVWGLMIVIFIAMIIYFKKKKWL